MLGLRKHHCYASMQASIDQHCYRDGKSPPLVRKAESLCCTCKLGPLHCQVAALHELQPVLNRQLINCSNKFSCGAVTWRLTQPGADVCQRLSAPFAACCKGAL